MTEAAANFIPDLHAPVARLATGLTARLEAERERWALWPSVKWLEQRTNIVDRGGICASYGRFLS